jgi:hypothetical protein
LKEEALDRTLCRTRFGTGYGPVVKADYAMNGDQGMDRNILGSNPGRGKNFFSKTSRPALGPTQRPINPLKTKRICFI